MCVCVCVIRNYINKFAGQWWNYLFYAPGDLGSIPGRVILKTLKMVFDTSLLNTQQYKLRFKGKVIQSWEKSSSYWKGSLLVALDYSRQIYLLIYLFSSSFTFFENTFIENWEVQLFKIE